MDFVVRYRATQRTGTHTMKSLFLCVLMMSIVMASYYRPSPALRRLLLNR